MKVRTFPTAAIKALLHLAQHPQAHLLIVAECCYLLDGSSKAPKHLHIPTAAFSALLEREWITPPEERGQQLAECAIAQAGKAAAASILALQSTYHQLEFGTDILQVHKGQKSQQSTDTKPKPLEELADPQLTASIEVQEAEPLAIIQAEPQKAKPRKHKTLEKTKRQKAKPRKHKTLEEAKAASIAKRAAMQKNMQQAVSSLLESIKAGKSERLLQYLSFSAKFHHYSPLNQLMIASQAPNATRVAGYTTWQNLGYQVRGGEKGIAILAPRPFAKVTKLNEETGEEETIGYQGVTFRVAYVFDVSQLEENLEKPLPTFFIPLADDHEVLYTCIAQAVRAEGIIVEIGDTGSAQGWSAGGHIRLKSGLDSTNRCLTLIHEFAHEKLHHNEAGQAMSTNKKECHAEAISFVVAHHFGINNPYSSDYLQSWSNTEKELLTELETIKATASAIIEAIEAQEAPTFPPCYYCQQPAAENAQILNGLAICAACIAEEIAAAHLDEMPTPTDPEPEPPTPVGGPSSIEGQETESEPSTPTDSPTPTEPESAALIEEVQNQNTTKASKRQAEKAQRKGAHRISLRWHSDAYTVSSEGYAKIKALIQEYATCHLCEKYYTAERLNVAGNICLECFMKEHGHHQGFTYVGPGDPSADGTARYLFLDVRGMIYITYQGPSASESGQKSETETLKYWSFPVPTHVNKEGKAIEIHGASWNIYGDPRRSVCVVHICDTYPDKIEAYYLVSNTGQLIQINKRKASHRALYIQAKKRLETMKANTSEWYIHDMIAQMLDEDASLWPVA